MGQKNAWDLTPTVLTETMQMKQIPQVSAVWQLLNPPVLSVSETTHDIGPGF